MDTSVLAHVAQLSDTDLLTRVKALAQDERSAAIALIVHLAELDERRLYLAEGYSSLFAYCTDVLHLSEHATYNRIEVARTVRRCPLLLRDLEEGSLNLTTARLLAPHLTPDNYEQVLVRVRCKPRREVEELVAGLRPQPPVPDTIRRLPSRMGEAAQPALSRATVNTDAPDGQPGASSASAELPAGPISTARSAAVTALAMERYKVTFTANAALHAKLRRAQALLRHQIPTGDLEQIFDRALTALLRDLEKQKIAATEHPREQVPLPRSHTRCVPAAVKREVWRRDGGRCAFMSKTGRRCGGEGLLEFHHVVPYAYGGPAATDNIELRCSAHNRYEAELFLMAGNFKSISRGDRSQLVSKRVDA